MHQSSNSAGDDANLVSAVTLAVSISAVGSSSITALSPFYKPQTLYNYYRLRHPNGHVLSQQDKPQKTSQ